MPKVHNEQNPNRLYDHETCNYSNTYCSKWYKKRTSCQNDGKLVPGNLSYLLSGFCNVTCLRGKFEDECRVDRVLTLIRWRLHNLHLLTHEQSTQRAASKEGSTGLNQTIYLPQISTFRLQVCTFYACCFCLSCCHV